MNPIILDNNRLNQPPLNRSLNTANFQAQGNGSVVIRKNTERLRFIRSGLSNALSMKQNPRQKLEYLLGLFSQQKNQSIKVDPFLTLLAQIKDEDLSCTKEEFIVEKIIHNKSLHCDFRLWLGTRILQAQTDPAKAKDILLKTIQYPDYENYNPISIALIEKAPKQLQPELYEDFLLNSDFDLLLRAEISNRLPDINKKSNIIECFTQDLSRFLKHCIRDNEDSPLPLTWSIGNNPSLELENLLVAFEKNNWIQEPGVQAVINQGIVSEREKLKENLNSNSEFECVAIPCLMQYIKCEDYKQELVQDIARSLLTFKYIDSFQYALAIYEEYPLIWERPIQEALITIGMNQVERSEQHLHFIFKALTCIQDPQKRDAILRNMFSETARGITFDDLKMFDALLYVNIEKLTEEECTFILLEVSASLDAMLSCTHPTGKYVQLDTIYSVFKSLYKKIEDPSVRLKSIQNMIFNTKASIDAGGDRGPYDSYLDTKVLRDLDEFVKAFSEVLLDPDTQGDYRPEIKELFNQSGAPFQRHTHPCEYRLYDYYSQIIERCYDSFPADIARDKVLTVLTHVLSMNILTPYLRESLVSLVWKEI